MRALLASAAALWFTTQPVAADILLYRVSGIFNWTVMQKATAIHCTNFDSAPTVVRVRIRNEAGTLVANVSATVPPNNTRTFASADTLAYNEDVVFDPGRMEQGVAVITAGTRKVVCSVNGLWSAFVTYPAGLGYHMARFNPAPGQAN